jgi:hypothetical protein
MMHHCRLEVPLELFRQCAEDTKQTPAPRSVAARSQARRQGVVVLRPEDVRDDWTRQALINEANRLYGRRPGGDR